MRQNIDDTNVKLSVKFKFQHCVEIIVTQHFFLKILHLCPFLDNVKKKDEFHRLKLSTVFLQNIAV